MFHLIYCMLESNQVLRHLQVSLPYVYYCAIQMLKVSAVDSLLTFGFRRKLLRLLYRLPRQAVTLTRVFLLGYKLIEKLIRRGNSQLSIILGYSVHLR